VAATATTAKRTSASVPTDRNTSVRFIVLAAVWSLSSYLLSLFQVVA
jgi:hypothetical protein